MTDLPLANPVANDPEPTSHLQFSRLVDALANAHWLSASRFVNAGMPVAAELAST